MMEFVELKRGENLNLGRWKVTARYTVQVSKNVRMNCVRLRFGVSEVRHFSEAEFKRLFKPHKE